MTDSTAPKTLDASTAASCALALGLALAGAWALGLADALWLRSALGEDFVPALGALLGIWSLLGLAALPLALGLRALTRRLLGARSAATHTGHALAVGLVAAGGLALHRVGVGLAQRSTDTLLLGTLLAFALLAPALLGLFGPIRRRLAGLLSDATPRRRQATHVLLVIPVSAMLLASLWIQHADFFLQLAAGLRPAELLAPLVPPGLALAGLALATRLPCFRGHPPEAPFGGHPPEAPFRGHPPEAPFGGHPPEAPFGGHPPEARTPRRARVGLGLLVALALLVVAMGVLVARGGGGRGARAVRDGSSLSGALVAVALRFGAAPPALTAAQGVRACTPGEALAAPGTIGRVEEDAPDILLITVDGLRFDRTSLDPQSSHPNTPRLLTHASRAAVFSRAYTPAPSTRAAFRSIFTGLLPGQVDAPSEPRLPWALTLTASQPTLAAYLREAGYETIALVSKPRAFPLETHALSGFSEVDDTPTPYHTRYSYSAQLKVSRIIGRLAEPPSSAPAPRFVWTHLIEPHFPYTRGPSDQAQHGSARNEVRHDQAVRYIDEQLDRLLTFALAPERRDRTLVIITSDHGEAFGEHRNARHGATVFEEEIHVPLVILGAGVRPGVRHVPVSLVELLPTILDLARLDVPGGVCGQGFADALRDGGEPPALPVYVAALPDATARYHQLAFLRGSEKLVINAENGRSQRYDLATDPREERADESSERTATLRGALAAYLRERGLDLPARP